MAAVSCNNEVKTDRVLVGQTVIMVTAVILSQDGLQWSLNLTDCLPWSISFIVYPLECAVCLLCEHRTTQWTPGVCTKLWHDSLTCWVNSVCRHKVRSTGTQHTAWRRPDLRSGGVKEVFAIPPIVTLFSYVFEWKPQSLLMWLQQCHYLMIHSLDIIEACHSTL